MIKSPLRYPGGKSRVSDYLVSMFPDFGEYREPFVGGGSIFLNVLDDKRKFWINDLYYDVYSFWKMMITDYEYIVKNSFRLYDEYYGKGKDLYDFLKHNMYIWRSENNYMNLSYGFFVMNRITFSGTSLSGGYSNESFNKRFTESSIARLVNTGKLMHEKDIDVTCEDYSKLLREEGDNVFMFLDPPYYTAEDSALYGMNGDMHRGFDHEKLKSELDICNHKWMMTYDDCDYIRELYKEYRIKPFEFTYGMRNVGYSDMKGKELIISNYDMKTDIVLF